MIGEAQPTKQSNIHADFSPLVRRMALLALVFLVIAAGRILRLSLDDKELHVDEVWSVWLALDEQKNFALDTNWPPLYYIALNLWQSGVGIHPVALRFFSTLLSLLGAAAAYRALRRLAHSEAAGWLGALAFSALALGLFFTTEVRGNALIYSLTPLAFWLILRYFDRPTFRRALPLALALAAMFYSAYTAFGAFLMFGLFTLAAYPRRVWRWALPGAVAALLAAPEIRRVIRLATGRVAATSQLNLEPFLPAIARLYEQYAGHSFLPWLALFVVATILAFYKRHEFRSASGLLLWSLSGILLYLSNPVLGFFSTTYGWFVAPGAALWTAFGLSRLPRWGRLAAALALIAVMFAPIPYDQYQAAGAPIGRSFAWLAEHAQWGDVVVIDPQWRDEFCYPDCINAEVWDYLIRIYFPQGLQIVEDPEDYRRVWYLKWDGEGWHDAELAARVREKRVESIFVGPYKALFRLYEGPPDAEGVPFANGLRFHGMDVVGESPRLLVRREGDHLRLRLWWSVDGAVAADYSIALHVYRARNLMMQSDSGPQLVDLALPPQTSAWQPGQYYVEERELTVPDYMPSGRYPIYLTVYQWWDGVRIDAPGVNDERLLNIGTLFVKAW